MGPLYIKALFLFVDNLLFLFFVVLLLLIVVFYMLHVNLTGYI